MTVAELIRELQALPLSSLEVYVRVDVSDGYDPIAGPDWENAPVDDVRHEGPYVLISTRW